MKRIHVVFIGVSAVGSMLALVTACGTRNDESAASVQFALTSVELPKRAELTYEVAQPELGGEPWSEKVVINEFGSKRKIGIAKTAGKTAQAAQIFTDKQGGFEPSTKPDAVWSRIDVLSTPQVVEVGAEWMPFTGSAHTYAMNDTSIIVDTTRVMRIAATYPRDSGAIVRAVYNVRLVLDEQAPGVKKQGLTNANWGGRDAVIGVGIADYYVSSTTRESFLLRSAEYTFANVPSSPELAIASPYELAARLSKYETVLTRRCITEGPAEVRSAAASIPEPESAFAFTSCPAVR